MDIFTKKSFLTWVIIILVILNLISLGTLWFTRLKHDPGPPHVRFDPENRRERVQEFLKRKLQLSEEQIRKISNLQEEYFQKSRELKQQSHQLRQMLTRELFTAALDTQRVNQLTEKIGSKEAALEKMRYKHFYELKSIFTSEQQRRFRILFRRLMERIRPPGPPDGFHEMRRPPKFRNNGRPPAGSFNP